MKKIALILFLLSTFCLKAQTKNANQITFPLVRYNFEAQPRTQLSPMSIKLFDDSYNVRVGKAPDSNNYGTLLAIYGRTGHWESNIYFGRTTRKMYFRTSEWYNGASSETTVKGGFNRWRTLLDSESNIASNGLLKLTGNGNHYFLKGNVGIGTTNPVTNFHIEGSGGHPTSNRADLEKKSSFILSSASRTPIGLGTLTRLYVGIGGDANYTWLQAHNSHQEGSVKNIALNPIGGKVGIGTTQPTAELSVNGKIHTKEVKIDLKLSDWADFVFKKDYNLPTLKEVENHIKEKGHLKDIPSAKEVAKNGILIGEMNSKLLQKIEELTLYIIQQEKEIKELKKQNSRIEKQENEIEKLKILINKLLEK